MGGSFGGMMLRHAQRMHGFSSNDPRSADAPPPRKKHPDILEADRELTRIKMTYRETKHGAVQEFVRGFSKIASALERSKLIRGDESIRELLHLGLEL